MKKSNVPMKKLSFLTICLISFLGCSEQTKTVDYYLKNKDECELKVQECKNNPGDLKNNPNCVNAMEARYKARFFNDVNLSGLRYPSQNEKERASDKVDTSFGRFEAPKNK